MMPNKEWAESMAAQRREAERRRHRLPEWLEDGREPTPIEVAEWREIAANASLQLRLRFRWMGVRATLCDRFIRLLGMKDNNRLVGRVEGLQSAHNAVVEAVEDVDMMGQRTEVAMIYVATRIRLEVDKIVKEATK